MAGPVQRFNRDVQRTQNTPNSMRDLLQTLRQRPAVGRSSARQGSARQITRGGGR